MTDIHIPAGNRTWASTMGVEHPRKEPFKQLVDSYLEHLLVSLQHYYTFSNLICTKWKISGL